MTGGGDRTHSAGRLFAAHAAISLVPVIIIGLLLGHSYATATERRGLEQALSQGEQLAVTIVEPRLTGGDLRDGLTGYEQKQLRAALDKTVRDGLLLRVRLRDLDGLVVFSPDGSGITGQPDAEAAATAVDGPKAHLTRFNSDGTDSGEAGPQAVEVYRVLNAGARREPVGVLEMYLPYEPIAADIAAVRQLIYRDLSLGLGILYLVLAGLAIGVNRRLRRQAAQNAYLAEHDSLTGLPNRRAFVEAVQRCAAGPGPRMAAVAICDLDRFKEVNDALGHQRGDELIRQIADRLTSLLRPGDLVARLGGDEFGVLLNRVVSAGDAEAILQRLRAAIAAPISVTDLPLTAEASIGFVLLPDDGDEAQTLLQRADIAMYVAKGSQAGVVRYDPGQDHVDADQLAVVAELQQALGAGTLRLDFQPKLELSDGSVEAVEALIRWHHPRHGELAPDAFLPVAEQTGLMDALTDWVIDTALEHARRWQEADRPLAVAVNISARNLSHPYFAERVLSSVAISGVPVDRLVLEITETALLTDVERANGTLAALRAAGVGISIDDFGQGQTSLGLLARLPISELKLDRAFVTTMCADDANRAIVRSLIDLAHSLGLRVVAEGVEDESTIGALRDAGCDAAQGYAIARPLHADQVLTWCAAQSRSFV